MLSLSSTTVSCLTRTPRRWEWPDTPWGASSRAAGRSSTQIKTNKEPTTFPLMVGLYTVGAVTVPVTLSPLLLRLSGGSSSYVYSLMYRYICIDFGYLSVIVFSTCIFSRPTAELAWTCTHSPSKRVRTCHSSFFSFLLSCLLISTSAPHLLFAFSCHVLSQAPCRSKASGLALPWGDDLASGPECFGSQTHTKGQGLMTLLQPNCCTLDMLSTAWRHNGSKLFTELGPFLTCSMDT